MTDPFLWLFTANAYPLWAARRRAAAEDAAYQVDGITDVDSPSQLASPAPRGSGAGPLQTDGFGTLH